MNYTNYEKRLNITYVYSGNTLEFYNVYDWVDSQRHLGSELAQYFPIEWSHFVPDFDRHDA